MDLDSIEALIAEMEKRRALWDVKAPGHYNRQVVCDEWEKVGENTGLGRDAAKTKWKNLRDTFKKELKKGRYGDCAEDPSQYIGTWPYFNSMMFIRSAFRQKNHPRYAQNMHYQNPESQDLLNDNDIDFSPLISRIEFLAESASDVGSHSLDQEPKSLKSNINGENQEPSHTARKRKKRNHHDFEELLEIERRKLSLLAPVPDDEDMLFFKSLIPHVKKLQDLRKLHFRSRVLHVLAEELKKEHDTDNPTAGSSKRILQKLKKLKSPNTKYCTVFL